MYNAQHVRLGLLDSLTGRAHTTARQPASKAMHTDHTDGLVQCGWVLGQAVWLWGVCVTYEAVCLCT